MDCLNKIGLKFLRLLVVITTLLCVLERRGSAEIVKLRLTGTVTVSDSTRVLPPDVTTGADFTAELSYDRSLADADLNPKLGVYSFFGSGLEFGLTLQVGSLTLYNDPFDDFVVQVTNDRSIIFPFGNNGDNFVVSGGLSAGGPGFGAPVLQCWFVNEGGTAWNNDALPAGFDRSVFERFEIIASGGIDPLARPYSITANVSTVSAVPEPRLFYHAVSLLVFAGFSRLCRRPRVTLER